MKPQMSVDNWKMECSLSSGDVSLLCQLQREFSVDLFLYFVAICHEHEF